MAINKSDEKDIIRLPNQRHIGNFLSVSHLHKRSKAPSLVPAISSPDTNNYYTNKANKEEKGNLDNDIIALLRSILPFIRNLILFRNNLLFIKQDTILHILPSLTWSQK